MLTLILDTVRAFCGHAAQRDDVTAVVVRYLGSATAR
jgi:serine phosphatase RsbU (regulator of sigma subunit)